MSWMCRRCVWSSKATRKSGSSSSNWPNAVGYTLRRNIVRIQYLGAQRGLKPGLRQAGQADGAAGAQGKPGYSAYLAGLCQRGGLGAIALKDAQLVYLFAANRLLGRQRTLQNAQVYPAGRLWHRSGHERRAPEAAPPTQEAEQGGRRARPSAPPPLAGQRAAAKAGEKTAKSNKPAGRRQPEGGLVAFLKIMGEEIIIRLGNALNGVCGKAVG